MNSTGQDPNNILNAHLGCADIMQEKTDVVEIESLNKQMSLRMNFVPSSAHVISVLFVV